MKVLVFGSLNIDRTYTVDHFVQPGETLSAARMDLFCGGKGFNQAIALARAGCGIYFAGALGSDGEMLEKELIESGIKLDYLSHVTAPCGHAVIQVDKSGQNCILISSGANGSIAPAYIDSVLSHFSAGDYIVLQNEIPHVDYIINEAKKREMVIAFNPSPYEERIQEYPVDKVDYLLINHIEGAGLSHEAELERIKAGLRRAYPGTNIILTLGARGALYLARDGKEYTCGIYATPVADTTAAGDTFAGYFLAGMIETGDIQHSLNNAAIASGIAVSRKGASPSIPYKAEVENCDAARLSKFY